MGRTEELSDFQRGVIIGCHLSKLSVREISAMLEMPRSTVSSVIVKWKRLGITTALPRSGRPHKLSNKDIKVLERVASENQLSSLTALTNEFQTASGRNISPRTVRRELQSLGFRGQEATRKPKSIKRCAKPALKPESEKTITTKENAASSNKGNPSVCKEDQGHADAQATSEPTDQPMDAEASTTSRNTEAQSRDLKSFEPFTYVDLNFNSDSSFSFVNQSVPTL
ncbi:hypothetical protein AMEX_G6194 [Astyanax mexicanus]|uniref:Transposase Tc1-like domain-containing protein n=1 Tax=Astyanax mexicanus TaxID=7994 RepID=A0A8T2M5C1_ASTMX|nr:hypothetical protein AMEX_G6194 [Astyanax mexicanus]